MQPTNKSSPEVPVTLSPTELIHYIYFHFILNIWNLKITYSIQVFSNSNTKSLPDFLFNVSLDKKTQVIAQACLSILITYFKITGFFAILCMSLYSFRNVLLKKKRWASDCSKFHGIKKLGNLFSRL